MKLTIEVPDELHRKAKAKAALSGRRLKDLVEEGLRIVVARPARKHSTKTAGELMKDVIGTFDSGKPDLGSNPQHLEGLGRDSLGDR